MPQLSVEFEVFCAHCDAGLCGETETRNSRIRGMPQMIVRPCPACMKDKDDEIERLEARIDQLKGEVDSLSSELREHS